MWLMFWIIRNLIINSEVVRKSLRSLNARMSNIGKIWSTWSKRSRNLRINWKRWEKTGKGDKKLFRWTERMFLPFDFWFQDSSKAIDLEKECEDSTNLIPKFEENIPKLQKLLLDEEKVLEEIKDNSKGNFFFQLCKMHYIFAIYWGLHTWFLKSDFFLFNMPSLREQIKLQLFDY